jgi:hypothetical protein
LQKPWKWHLNTLWKYDSTYNENALKDLLESPLPKVRPITKIVQGIPLETTQTTLWSNFLLCGLEYPTPETPSSLQDTGENLSRHHFQIRPRGAIPQSCTPNFGKNLSCVATGLLL